MNKIIIVLVNKDNKFLKLTSANKPLWVDDVTKADQFDNFELANEAGKDIEGVSHAEAYSITKLRNPCRDLVVDLNPKRPLTLLDIARYLPYGIRAIDLREHLPSFNHTCPLMSVIESYGFTTSGIFTNSKEFKCWLPTLNSMDLLLKEIPRLDQFGQLTAVKFTPIVELFNMATTDIYDEPIELETIEFHNDGISGISGVNRYGFTYNKAGFDLSVDGLKLNPSNQFAMQEKLYEWLFDVNGLIGRELVKQIEF